MAKEKKHVSHVEAARHMAVYGWGNHFESVEEAVKKLDVPAGALLALLRRVEQVCSALGRDDKPHEYDSYYKEIEVNKDAATFPDAVLGQLLYCCDELEDGVSTVVVVGKNAAGNVLVIDSDPTQGVRPRWATGDYFVTVAGALKNRADEDVIYHRPKLELATRVLAAVESGADLTEFEEGVGSGSEEDDSDG